jgi:hypothetical protein
VQRVISDEEELTRAKKTGGRKHALVQVTADFDSDACRIPRRSFASAPFIYATLRCQTPMSLLEAIFNSSVLDLVVPDASVDFPSSSSEDWLDITKSQDVNRAQAFFGECLTESIATR